MALPAVAHRPSLRSLPGGKQRVRYEPRGASKQLLECRDGEVLCEGPVGTGKTYGLLWKAHLAALKYPGMKALLLRKTQTSLTSSAIATYTQKVLTTGRYGVRPFSGNIEEPAGFRYPNGSKFVVGGMDKASKVMSTEYDMALIFEATELTLDDYESVTTRLRNGAMPYQQLIADCNPGAPSHWINQRANDGELTRLLSRHKDNPKWWDSNRGEWTPEGYAYVIEKLDKLTGVRRKRLRDGIWAAAEGQVYEEWDPDIHLIDLAGLVALGVLHADGTVNRNVIRQIVVGVDWGYTNPGVMLVFAVDGDGRMYLIREIYLTRRTIDWWIEQGKALKNEFGALVFICDPSEPGYIAQFNAAGLQAEKGMNDIKLGIDAVKQRLLPPGDGRPRLVCYRDAIVEIDEELKAVGRPWSVTQEMESYVWPPGTNRAAVLRGVPVDDNNHGLDGLRYGVAHLDLGEHAPAVVPVSMEQSNTWEV